MKLESQLAEKTPVHFPNRDSLMLTRHFGAYVARIDCLTLIQDEDDTTQTVQALDYHPAIAQRDRHHQLLLVVTEVVKRRELHKYCAPSVEIFNQT
ncbi:hypothetical protein D3C77_430220 [compost metagenome]